MVKLTTIRIRNYKGFKDTGDLALEPGFNVVVGQNNAGKSALLEALARFPDGNKPHRNQAIPKGRGLQQYSEFEATVDFSGQELLDALLSRPEQFAVVVKDDISGEVNAAQWLTAIFQKPSLRPTLRWNSKKNWHQEGNILGFPIKRKPANHLVIKTGPEGWNHVSFALGDKDELAPRIHRLVENSIYVFRAERMSLGECKHGDIEVLDSTAANLASVLLHLSTRNRNRYARFEELVRRVFPSVTQVAAVTQHGKPEMAEIRLWSDDPRSERDDLAIKLSESGTGIGQVLAILHVIITSTTPKAIAI